MPLYGVFVDQTPWTVTTPTPAVSGGTATATATIRYKLLGKTLCFSLVIVVTTGSGAGFLQVNLPYNCAINCAGGGKETSTTGKALTWEGLLGGPTLTLRMADAAATAVTGYSLEISAAIEIQ